MIPLIFKVTSLFPRVCIRRATGGGAHVVWPDARARTKREQKGELVRVDADARRNVVIVLCHHVSTTLSWWQGMLTWSTRDSASVSLMLQSHMRLLFPLATSILSV